MKTVEQLLEDIEFIVGHDKDSCLALQWLNQARQILYPLGDFVGTIGYACIPTVDGCFCLPRDASHLKSAWTCKKINITLTPDPCCSTTCSDLCGIIGKKASIQRVVGNFVFPSKLKPRTILGFRPSDAEDAGKKVFVGYKDVGGSSISEKVTLAGIKETAWIGEEVLELRSISKEETVGAVNVYSSFNGCVELIDVIEHWESSVSRIKYKLVGCDSVCMGISYKKKFVKYTTADLSFPADIENAVALSHAMNSIKLMQEKSTEASGLELRTAKGFLEVDRQDLRPISGPAIIPRQDAVV